MTTDKKITPNGNPTAAQLALALENKDKIEIIMIGVRKKIINIFFSLLNELYFINFLNNKNKGYIPNTIN